MSTTAPSATATHEVLNQPPPLAGRNLFEDHAALQEGLEREGAGWARDRVRAAGAFWGGEPMQWGAQANEHPPVLHTHDRYGHRLDEVEFHPAWHALMRAGVEHELHALPWRRPRRGAHVARAATYLCSAQAEAGFGCPITMTFAAVPALRAEPELADRWTPLLTATTYDPRLRAADEKGSALCGMAMTEKQGGSDVRANTTRAWPATTAGGRSPGTSGSAARRCATCSSSWRRPRTASPASRCRACCPTGRATRASSSSA